MTNDEILEEVIKHLQKMDKRITQIESLAKYPPRTSAHIADDPIDSLKWRDAWKEAPEKWKDIFLYDKK